MKNNIYSLFVLMMLAVSTMGQTGLTVGPPRVYFVANTGSNQSQVIDVTNPSQDYTMELAVSLEDWRYNVYGDNELGSQGTFSNSCSAWLSFSEPFFSLKPGETKKLTLNMQVPTGEQYNDTVPVHTSMLFITQLNPRQGIDRDGANIKIAVRSGVKIYHRFPGREISDLEITNLQYIQVDSIGNFLETEFDVSGTIWMQGQIRTELINQESGLKTVLDDVAFYCLPGDKRKQYLQLPDGLAAGNYLASIMFFYGEENMVKAAELEFDYEPST